VSNPVPNRPARSLCLVALCLLPIGCTGPTARADDGPATPPAGNPTTVRPSEDEAYVLGTHALKDEGGIVDGDTVKVEGLARSLRLILIDCEEMPHASYDPKWLKLMEADFPAYVKAMTLGAERPVKYPTPLGREAKVFAERFFEGVEELRLEVDVPGQGKDTHGRTLCYAWAIYGDERAPKLYNLEVVRAGMSPYYVKYGRSRRFDAAFRAAEAEAREAKRGIWADDAPHYPDYDARLAWWGRRAEALDRYAKIAKDPRAPLHVEGRSAIQKLLKRVGGEVYVFGLIDDHDPRAVTLHEDGATLRLGGEQQYIEVEVQGQELAKLLDVKRFFGEFVTVRGALDREGSPIEKGGETRYMRVVVKEAKQIAFGHELTSE
jgi:endonuclease YncB( thermonuclease family)